MIAQFFQPHDEAARLVAQKTPVQKRIFKGLLPELRARAFTVAGLKQLDEIGRVQDLITDYTRGQTATGEAVTWDTAKKQIVAELPFLDAAAANKRATVLLRTHGFQAQQSAQYNQDMENDYITHFKYIATEDARVRDEHLALHGIVLPKDDPFWDDHFPPWDWGCRCQTVGLSKRAVERERARDEKRPPENRRVMEGPMLDQLRNGQLIRGPRKLQSGKQLRGGSFNVSAPAKTQGAAAFQWNPKNLRLDWDQLREKYRGDHELWTMFEVWSRATELSPGVTVYLWLSHEAEAQRIWSQSKSISEASTSPSA